MNVGEYGNVLRFNVKEDISTSTNTITFTDPTGKEFTRDTVLGTDTIETNRGRFNANEYIEYTFQEGDIGIPGQWNCRVSAQFSDKLLKSDQTRFRVKP